MQKLSEEEIISKLRNRDRSALDYLYSEYSLALFGVVYRFVNNREMAEECLQDCYYKIWNRFSLYDEKKGRLYTWMINIARNTAKDMVRSKDFQQQLKVQPLESNVSIIASASETSPSEDLDVKELIKELNTKYMMVMDLVYFQGYTHRDAAQELDLPLGTLKTRVKKALDLIRNNLSAKKTPKTNFKNKNQR